ncbi:MAG: hypothetical protein AAF467_19235 [Actinomycetota bacterium]
MADTQANEAGRAWGARARDWATLMEPFNRAVFRDVLDALTVGPFEFAHVAMCARAYMSAGPWWPAIDNAGPTAVHALVEEAATPFTSPTTGIVRLQFNWSWVTGHRDE